MDLRRNNAELKSIKITFTLYNQTQMYGFLFEIVKLVARLWKFKKIQICAKVSKRLLKRPVTIWDKENGVQVILCIPIHGCMS